MNKLSFNINNQRALTVEQIKHDGKVFVDNSEEIYYITSGDFITMLNWYRYQKRIGNDNLEF